MSVNVIVNVDGYTVQRNPIVLPGTLVIKGLSQFLYLQFDSYWLFILVILVLIVVIRVSQRDEF